MLYKKCKVVMLPTEKATNIFKSTVTKQPLYFNEKRQLGKAIDSFTLIPQHLYFLSDEEIKEGDWYMVTDFSKIEDIRQATKYLTAEQRRHNGYKKIIATTDESLNTKSPCECGATTYEGCSQCLCTLPRPSNEFIKKYCELGGIDEVLVEYEEILDDAGILAIAFNEPDWRLKVAPDNTIAIKQIKDSWNRQEVENLLRKFNDENNNLFLKSEKEHIVESFIKSNL